MDTTSLIDNDDTPPAVLEPVLDLVARILDNPAAAVTSMAVGLSIAAISISVLATLLGAGAGAGFAAVYTAAAWSLSFYLKRRSGAERHDA